MMDIVVKKGTRIICLDASGKPESIKTQDWLVEGREYTVVKVIHAKIQNRLGYVLEEIQTGDPLFFGYSVSRFTLSIFELFSLIEKQLLEVEDRVELRDVETTV